MNILSFPIKVKFEDRQPPAAPELDEEIELIHATKLLMDLLTARATEPGAISLESIKREIRNQEDSQSHPAAI